MDTDSINVLREFVVAEKSDGNVYLNIRSTTGWRALFDGTRVIPDDELRDVACHAGLAAHNGVWYFSHPSPLGERATGSLRGRRERMMLRISTDEGETWPREIEVNSLASAYSDVAVLADGTVLVLFENGQRGKP